MKKFINDPENLTSELLEGLALANKDIIHLEDGNLVVNNKLKMLTALRSSLWVVPAMSLLSAVLSAKVW